MPQIGIIVGADGPTAVFVTSGGSQWVNWTGVIFILMLLLPNALYLIKGGSAAPCKNKVLEIAEQIGRCGCMALMVLGPGIRNTGYITLPGLALYLFGNLLLVLAYWICWLLFFRREHRGLGIALAVLPACVFLLSAAATHDALLGAFALLFGAAHLSITRKRPFAS